MGWTERQRELLAAMGLRLWSPTAPSVSPAAPGTEALSPVVPASGDEASGAGRHRAEAPVAALQAPLSAPAGGLEAPVPVAPPARPAPTPRAAAPTAPATRVATLLANELVPLHDERAQQIARLDWAGLQQAVADCRACGLCESRRQTVFGVGHPQARWMIVGEAPGANEDAQGEPFVGDAGQLLDRMLAALKLTRAEAPPAQQVFIANSLKCRPPSNRNPTSEELALCAPFLARQIELVRPQLILAMGRFAIQRLLGTDEAVGKLRGRVHPMPTAHGEVPVVVTYHPAYLLRQPQDKRKAWDDLCLAARVARDASAQSPA